MRQSFSSNLSVSGVPALPCTCMVISLPQPGRRKWCDTETVGKGLTPPRRRQHHRDKRAGDPLAMSHDGGRYTQIAAGSAARARTSRPAYAQAADRLRGIRRRAPMKPALRDFHGFCSVAMLLGFCLASLASQAQDATWLLNPPTGEFNSALCRDAQLRHDAALLLRPRQ